MDIPISEFNKLHNYIKTIVLAIIFMMPIWYMDIFMFDRQIINSNEVHIPILLSYCLTIAWLIINFSIMLLIAGTQGFFKLKIEGDAMALYIGAIFGIVWLIVASATSYLFKSSFIEFVKMSFSSSLSLLFFVYFYALSQRQKD